MRRLQRKGRKVAGIETYDSKGKKDEENKLGYPLITKFKK